MHSSPATMRSLLESQQRCGKKQDPTLDTSLRRLCPGHQDKVHGNIRARKGQKSVLERQLYRKHTRQCHYVSLKTETSPISLISTINYRRQIAVWIVAGCDFRQMSGQTAQCYAALHGAALIRAKELNWHWRITKIPPTSFALKYYEHLRYDE